MDIFIGVFILFWMYCRAVGQFYPPIGPQQPYPWYPQYPYPCYYPICGNCTGCVIINGSLPITAAPPTTSPTTRPPTTMPPTRPSTMPPTPPPTTRPVTPPPTMLPTTRPTTTTTTTSTTSRPTRRITTTTTTTWYIYPSWCGSYCSSYFARKNVYRRCILLVWLGL